MDTYAHKVGKCLPGISHDLGCLWRSCAKHSRDIDGCILENGIRSTNGAKITTGPSEWYPGGRGDLAILIDHFGCEIGSTASRVKEWCCPVGKRNARTGGTVCFEVTKTIGDRLAHSIGIDTRQGGQNPGGGM